MVLVDPDTYESSKKPPARTTAAGMSGGDFYYDVPAPAPSPIGVSAPVPTATGMGGGDFYYEAPTPAPVAGPASFLGGPGPLTETVPDTYDLAPITPTTIGPVYTPSPVLGIQDLQDPYARSEADLFQNVGQPAVENFSPYDVPLTPQMLGDNYQPASEFMDAYNYSNLYGGYTPRVRPEGRGMVDVEGMDIFQPGQPFTLRDLSTALQDIEERRRTYGAFTQEMDNQRVATQFEPVRNLTPSEAFRAPGEGFLDSLSGQVGRMASGFAGAPGKVADYAPTLLPTMEEIKGGALISVILNGMMSGDFATIDDAIRFADDETKQGALQLTMTGLSGQLALQRMGVDTFDLPGWQQLIIDSVAAPVNLLGGAEIASAARAGGAGAGIRALGREAGQEIAATTLGIAGANLAEQAGAGTGGQIAAGLLAGGAGSLTPGLIRATPGAIGRAAPAVGRGIDATTNAQNSILRRLNLVPEIEGETAFFAAGGPTGKRPKQSSIWSVLKERHEQLRPEFERLAQKNINDFTPEERAVWDEFFQTGDEIPMGEWRAMDRSTKDEAIQELLAPLPDRDLVFTSDIRTLEQAAYNEARKADPLVQMKGYTPVKADNVAGRGITMTSGGMSRNVMAHEVAHDIYNALPERLKERWEAIVGKRSLTPFERISHYEKVGEWNPTPYALTNPHEDFAESWAIFRTGNIPDDMGSPWLATSPADGPTGTLGPMREQFLRDVDEWLKGSEVRNARGPNSGSFRNSFPDEAPMRPNVARPYRVDADNLPIRHADIVEVTMPDGTTVRGEARISYSENPEKVVIHQDGKTVLSAKEVDAAVAAGGTLRRVEAYDPYSSHAMADDMVAELGFDLRSAASARAKDIDSFTRTHGIDFSEVDSQVASFRKFLADQVMEQRTTGVSFRGPGQTGYRRLNGYVNSTNLRLGNASADMKAKAVTPSGGSGTEPPTPKRARQRAAANNPEATPPALARMLEGKTPEQQAEIRALNEELAAALNGENPHVPVENTRAARGEVGTPEVLAIRHALAPDALPAFSRDLPENIRAAEEISAMERGLSSTRQAPLEEAISSAKELGVMPGIVNQMEDSLAAFKEADARVQVEAEGLEAAARRIETETNVSRQTGRTSRIDNAMEEWDTRIEALRKAREARAEAAADILFRADRGLDNLAWNERVEIQGAEERAAVSNRIQAREEARAFNEADRLRERRRFLDDTRALSDSNASQASMFGDSGGGRRPPTIEGTSSGGSVPPPKGFDDTANVFIRAGNLAHEAFKDVMGYIATRFTTGLLDVSFLLRQGIWMTTHPIDTLEAVAFASRGLTPRRAAAQFDKLRNSRAARWLVEFDPEALPDPNGVGSAADERFMSRLVHIDPTLRPSQAWNSLFISHLRLRMMEKGMRALEAGYGVNAVPSSARKRVAASILHATGRGTGDTVQKISDLTGSMFFVRFQASVVQRVGDMAWAMSQLASGRFTPEAKWIFQEHARFVLGMNAVLGATAYAANEGLLPGVEKVNYTNPFRSDWGQFKINGKTYDPWGGARSWARMVTGVGMLLGQRETEDASNLVWDFASDRLTPGYDQLKELFIGKDYQGRPIDRTSLETYQEMMTDLAFGGALAEVVEAYKQDGIEAAAFTIPELGGIGVGGRWGGEEAYQREEDAQRLAMAQEMGLVPESEDNPRAVNRLTAAQRRDLDIAYREKYGSRDEVGEAYLDAAIERDKAFDTFETETARLSAQLEALAGVPHDPADETTLRVKLRGQLKEAEAALRTSLNQIAERLEKENPGSDESVMARMLSDYYAIAKKYENPGGEFDYEGFQKERKETLTRYAMTPGGVAVIAELEKREAQKDRSRSNFERELDIARKTLQDFWDRDDEMSAVDYFLKYKYERGVAQKWGYSVPATQHADRLDQWNRDQLALDARYAANEITPEEWVDEMRAMRTKARAEIDGFYSQYPDQDMPAYTVMERWYDIIEQNTNRATGDINWDAVNEAAKGFTAAEMEEITRVTDEKRARWSTPIVEEYYSDMARIASTEWGDTGVTYWEIDDEVYRMWADYKGYTEYGDTWDEFASNAYPELLQMARETFPDRSESDLQNLAMNALGKWRNEWAKYASDYKKQMREEEPAVGIALRKWRIAGYGQEELEENPQYRVTLP